MKIHAVYFTCSNHFNELYLSIKSLINISESFIGSINVFCDKNDIFTEEQRSCILDLNVKIKETMHPMNWGGAKTVINKTSGISEVANSCDENDLIMNVDSDTIFLSNTVFKNAISNKEDFMGEKTVTTFYNSENHSELSKISKTFTYFHGCCYFVRAKFAKKLLEIYLNNQNEIFSTIKRITFTKDEYVPDDPQMNLIMIKGGATFRNLGSINVSRSNSILHLELTKDKHWSNAAKLIGLNSSGEHVIFNGQRDITPQWPNKMTKNKHLFATPIGKYGKQYFEKIFYRFGTKLFDYLLFVYDDTIFNREITKNCSIIREKGNLWQFAKKYLLPEYCSNYEYVWFWNDDIDIVDFDPIKYIQIIEKNKLEMSQPSLSPDSCFYVPLTLKNTNYHIGRITDFVEVMIPVFSNKAWNKFWNIIEKDYNFSGAGYDVMAKSMCNFNKMGIVDCCSVKHTRLSIQGYSCFPFSRKEIIYNNRNKNFMDDFERFLKNNSNYQMSEQKIIGELL